MFGLDLQNLSWTCHLALHEPPLLKPAHVQIDGDLLPIIKLRPAIVISCFKISAFSRGAKMLDTH